VRFGRPRGGATPEALEHLYRTHFRAFLRVAASIAGERHAADAVHVWTDPKLIPEWWGDGTVVEEMDVRPGGTYRFPTAFGVVEGEFREVDTPERLVQTSRTTCRRSSSRIWATGRS
jgi:hypothetical protein